MHIETATNLRGNYIHWSDLGNHLRDAYTLTAARELGSIDAPTVMPAGSVCFSRIVERPVQSKWIRP